MTLTATTQRLLSAAALLFAATSAHAQAKVASYAVGKPGTAGYEHLSFWVKDGTPTDIYYAYGPERKEVKLAYAGKKQVSGKPGFKVRFPNKHVLYIVPSGANLKVMSAKVATPKTYAWEYEGPVNGIGTFCRECAADEKEAIRIVQASYVE